jgi:hypothetical protein
MSSELLMFTRKVIDMATQLKTTTSVLPIHATNNVQASTQTKVNELVLALERDGVVRLPTLVSGEQLRRMQSAFTSRLNGLAFNNADGHHRTEVKRMMVEDVLSLEQGFVDIGLHPLVVETIRRYVGDPFELCEAKGWRSLEALHDFHGWHGDAWYDQSVVKGRIPREIKLAFYLSDVSSGAFQYLRGTHAQHVPRLIKKGEVDRLPLDKLEEFSGPAGTALLFDTSGIHRQGIPILTPRNAVFYNYHDPHVPLQAEDIEYYRYHPLILNAAFLGNLSSEHMKILGFGNTTRYQPNFSRKSNAPWVHALATAANTLHIHTAPLLRRVKGRLVRIFSGA